MPAEKKLISRMVIVDLGGPIKSAIDQLIPYLNDAKYRNAHIRLGLDRGYADHSDYPAAYVEWQEVETDEEFKIRIEEERLRLEARKAEYERLKKEFGE